MTIEQYSLSRDGSALVLVDIQERLAAAMDPKVMEQTVKNAVILLETARIFALPVVVSEQYRKGLGATLPAVQEKLGGIPVHEKLHFDCVRDDALGTALARTGRNTFIVAGMETHVCVFQTALSLLGKGYRVVVASDAVVSRRKHDWKYALRALAGAGAVIYPTETISFMLLEKAGTPEFKRLAPMFK